METLPDCLELVAVVTLGTLEEEDEELVERVVRGVDRVVSDLSRRRKGRNGASPLFSIRIGSSMDSGRQPALGLTLSLIICHGRTSGWKLVGGWVNKA